MTTREVPVEPTEVMIAAGVKAFLTDMRDRRLLKWLFSEQNNGAIGYALEDQIECAGQSVAKSFAAMLSAAAPVQRETGDAARISELEKLVYVPGLWRCPKCEFHLVQSNLNANTGSVTARDEAGDKCPNCDSPLWRVSYRDVYKDTMEHADQMAEELLALRAPSPTDTEGAGLVSAAIEHLRTCQEQLDMDGCMVGVSRQALDEVLAFIAKSTGKAGT